MNNTLRILFFLLGLSSTVLYSQNIWTKLYGGSNEDSGNAVIQTYDNDYLFVCNSRSFGAGYYDIWLIKTNQNGDTLWTKTFGGSGLDAAGGPNCIVETNDKCYIITGSTRSFSEGGVDSDLYLIKIDSEGSLLWEKHYNTGVGECGYAIVNTQDNNYLIIGSKSSSENMSTWLIKVDSYGKIIWDKTYDESFRDLGSCLINDYTEGFIIGGSKYNSDKQYMWLVKCDANGDTLWTKQFSEGNSNQSQNIISVHLNDIGGYSLICSISNSYGFRLYFIKTTSSGEIVMEKTFAGQVESDMVLISSAETTHDGGYILTGQKGNDFFDLILIKLSANFNTEWIQVSQNDNWLNWIRGSGIRESNDFGFVLAGWFGDNAMLMKTDSLGKFIMHEYTSVILTDNKQYLFSLSQNYPNPFNPSTTISYSLSQAGFVQLKVYDLLGRDVVTLVNREQIKGNYKINFNASNLTSGIYFYKLQSGSFTNTKKLILLQ